MDDVAILHEDNSILVVVKPQNIPSQADASGDLDLLSLLKQYIKDKYAKLGNVYLGLVHRLDRPTGGVMVFAKNSKAAERLSKQIVDGEMTKQYLATVLGAPKERKGTLVNYLKKNALTNNVYVATFGDHNAKRAELSYEVLESNQDLSLVKVQLGTGRSHQIRVQFSAIGCPVFGDVRYGGDVLAKGYNLALWAYRLEFSHPISKNRMVFVAYPPESEPWKRFEISKFVETFSDSDDSEEDGVPLFTNPIATDDLD
ncbi:MAG: RluA family pseudouridine synthase [Clostridiales bacterium]|nr:RluA family pseudouridine synthase [Clostridiales bacterium]